jgi:hypothetical protein
MPDTADLDRQARHAAADIRDEFAAERDREGARRAPREKALDALDDRDPHGRAALVRRDALLDRQASAADRLAAASDRAAERDEAAARAQGRALRWDR